MARKSSSKSRGTRSTSRRLALRTALPISASPLPLGGRGDRGGKGGLRSNSTRTRRMIQTLNRPDFRSVDRSRKRLASLFSLSPARLFKTVVCAKRKVRREVMFARGGAGSRKMRKGSKSLTSGVKC